MTEYPNDKSTGYSSLVIEYWVLVINWSLVIGDWLFIVKAKRPVCFAVSFIVD